MLDRTTLIPSLLHYALLVVLTSVTLQVIPDSHPWVIGLVVTFIAASIQAFYTIGCQIAVQKGKFEIVAMTVNNDNRNSNIGQQNMAERIKNQSDG